MRVRECKAEEVRKRMLSERGLAGATEKGEVQTSTSTREALSFSLPAFTAA